MNAKPPTNDELKTWLLSEGDFSWFQFAHDLIIRQERIITAQLKKIAEVENL